MLDAMPIIAGMIGGALCVWLGYWLRDRIAHNEPVGLEPLKIADVEIPELDENIDVVTQPSKVTPA